MGRRKRSEILAELSQVTTPSGEKIDMSKLKAPINEWVQKPEDTYLDYTVQKCFINFPKAFPGVPYLDKYNTFLIKKDSYSNQLPIICRYINFFINTYDKEMELMMAYLNIAYVIDNEESPIQFHGLEEYQQFVDYCYEMIFTDSIISKIHRIVEENYLDDIETDDGSKKYALKEKKHLESLEFTNEHIKTLLKISFGIKILTPVLFHYIAENKIVVNKSTPHLFNAYKGLFKIFSETCDMYNKLFVYVKFWRTSSEMN